MCMHMHMDMHIHMSIHMHIHARSAANQSPLRQTGREISCWFSKTLPARGRFVEVSARTFSVLGESTYWEKREKGLCGKLSYLDSRARPSERCFAPPPPPPPPGGGGPVRVLGETISCVDARERKPVALCPRSTSQGSSIALRCDKGATTTGKCQQMAVRNMRVPSPWA